MAYIYEYPRPAVTTDAIIVCREGDENYILLIQRLKDPFAGEWALPGGFVDMDESLEEGCKRELAEETSLVGIPLTQFHTFGAVNRDPRGRTISVVFYGFVSERVMLCGGDDAAQAKWFSLDELPHLAFDHSEIINRFRKGMSIAKLF